MPWPLDIGRASFLGLEVLDASLERVADAIMSRDADQPFGYLVTPNADHLARLRKGDAPLAACYRAATGRVLDSRFIANLARMTGLPVPHVVPGSDLLERLMTLVPKDTPITVIGTTAESVVSLTKRHALTAVEHIYLPFGFDPNDPQIMEACRRTLARRPAKLVLLACGSPRQEILAKQLSEAGAAGFGLCIGSAVDQIGGHVRRAPAWLRLLRHVRSVC